MLNSLNEKNRRDLGVAWLLVGFVFLASGFSGGVVFFILGVLWLATVNNRGLLLFQDNPQSMQNRLHKLTIGLLVLAFMTLLVNAV